MKAVFKRELRSYLQSPVGYVYLFMFTIITGFMFKVCNLEAGGAGIGSTDTVSYFGWIRYTLIVTIPLLAMKLFPEERKNKTDQILITSPISIGSMVVGKFFAAYILFLIGLVPSVANMIFLSQVGHLEVGIVIGNYISLLFVGAAFLAIGVFVSSMTESMITAFVMGTVSLAFFAVADMLSSSANNTIVTKIVNAISVTQRYNEFNQGLFNVSSIVYFLSLAVIFLFLTVRVIDKRRWS